MGLNVFDNCETKFISFNGVCGFDDINDNTFSPVIFHIFLLTNNNLRILEKTGLFIDYYGKQTETIILKLKTMKTAVCGVFLSGKI